MPSPISIQQSPGSVSILVMEIRMQGDDWLTKDLFQLDTMDITRPPRPQRIVGQHLTPQTKQSASQTLTDLPQAD